jgi:hypothetical protein
LPKPKPVDAAVAAAKRAAELLDSKRPYRNHYAGGMNIGACSTPVGAAVAAFKHLLMGEASNAQLVHPDGHDMMRLHWTSAGISCWAPPHAFERPTKIVTPVERAEKEEAAAARAARPKLRRVK